MSSEGPTDFIAKLLKANEAERATLIGQTNHLKCFVLMLGGFIKAKEPIEAFKVTYQIKNYPGIDELLSHPENLKQVIIGFSQITPILYDLNSDLLTNEAIHANLKKLLICRVILSFFNSKIAITDEMAANLKISLIELLLNLATHCERFTSLGQLDPEWHECHLALCTSTKYRLEALKIYQECETILAEPEAPFARYLWRFTIAKIQAEYGMCQIGFKMRDRAIFDAHFPALRETVSHAMRNITLIANSTEQKSAEINAKMLSYCTKLKGCKELLDQPDTTLDLLIKEFYQTISQQKMVYGLQTQTKLSDVVVSQQNIDVSQRIQQLESMISQKIDGTQLVQRFKEDLEAVEKAYVNKTDDKTLLGLVTLMRVWFRTLINVLPHVRTQYTELCLESVYLIRKSLTSKLSKDLPSEYVENITASLNAYQHACKTEIGSLTALADWIKGPEKIKKPTVSRRKQQEKPKSKAKSTSSVKKLPSAIEHKSASSSASTEETEETEETKEKSEAALCQSLTELSLNEEIKPLPPLFTCLPVKLAYPIPMHAFNIMSLLKANGSKIYIYGGFVRDAIFSKPWHDIDLVSDCDERQLLRLFPNAKKNIFITDVNNYSLESGVSITLVADLDLVIFSKNRYLAVEALFADVAGQLIDPLNVYQMMCDPQGMLAPIPSVDLIQSFTEDPSRIFRLIRSATHLQRAWTDSFYQAVMITAPNINRLPFGKFLHQFSELFLRGDGLLHWYICYNMGLIPHIALTLGADWNTGFNDKSPLFSYIKMCLSQIDCYPSQKVTSQNRLYLLALFLLPALEKARILHFKTNETIYSHEQQTEIVESLVEAYFARYQGEIDPNDKNAKCHQLAAILNKVLWPAYLMNRYQALEQKAMMQSYACPPPAFYMPIEVHPNDGIHAPYTTFIPFYALQQNQPIAQPIPVLPIPPAYAGQSNKF